MWYLIAAYVLLSGRLAYLQVIKHSFYVKKSQEISHHHEVLFAKRGTIYDRNMTKLAMSVDAYNIDVHPKLLKANKAVVAKALAGILGIDEQKLLLQLATKDFVSVAKRVDVQIGDRIKKARIDDGIDILRTTKRVYPNGDLACHILGFVDSSGAGREGLEKVYDKELRGRDGRVDYDKFPNNDEVPGTRRGEVDPVDGKDIILTIDSMLQHDLESDLRTTYEAHKAAGASSVIMQPETGEIIALANMPTFDPNKPGAAKPEQRRNRVVSDLYEPGSTLKTITACAGIQSKAITVNDTWYCKGSIRIGNHTVRCSLHGHEFAHGHGVVNMAKMLKYSCNIAAAGVGKRLGKQRLYNFEKSFGMYEKPGTGMPGEARGWRDDWKKWPDIRLANVAFGQGIAVTPMQMARAYGAVCNGGLLMRPYIVKQVMKGDTPEKVNGPHISRRVLSEETSAVVSQSLIGCVEEGTGQKAQVDGYKVGGKTGSAQKAIGGHYVAGKIVASFAGFLPVTHPKAVILVAVDEPQGSHFGAVVAAPVFQSAAKRTMWRMKIRPDDPSNIPVSPALPSKIKPVKPSHAAQTQQQGRTSARG